MRPTRTLLVDDEPLARERLRNFLAREPGVELAGECAHGAEAVERIRTVRPDLVFLDVQMPGMNGFEVLEQLGDDLPPAVVFVTAHDHYAVRAFQVHAVDYLLKPFDRDRLHLAVTRATERLARNAAQPDLPARNAAMAADLRAGATQPERLPVRSGSRVSFVQFSEIDWIGSADNYVELHVGRHAHLIRETLTSMAGRLPADQFVRISRTAIVNLRRVRELQPLPHGEYQVTLTDGTRLTLSRSHRDQLPRLGLVR